MQWHQPQPPHDYVWPFWHLVKESQYLRLFKHKTPFLSEYPFIIQSKQNNEYIVAFGKSEAEINKKWEWLEHNVVSKIKEMSVEDAQSYVLSKVYSLSLEKLSEPIKKAEPRIHSKILDDEDIMNDWTELDVKVSKQGDILATMFDLPNEGLIASYSITLWESLPRTGTLYLSMNYICFRSSIGLDLRIPFTEVVSLHKEEYPGLPGVIKVETLSFDFKISIYFKCNELYVIMEQLWKRAMDTLEKSALYVKNTEDKSIAEDNITLEEIKQQIEDILSKQELQDKNQNEFYCKLFHLPPSEILWGTYPCSIVCAKLKGPDSFNNLWRATGNIYISNSFLSFRAEATEGTNTLTFVLCYSDIKKLKKKTNGTNPEYSIFGKLGILPSQFLVFTPNFMFEIQLVNRQMVYRLLVDRCTDFRKDSIDRCTLRFKDLRISNSYAFPKNLLTDPKQFSEDFFEREARQSLDIDKYCSIWGSFTEIAKTPLLFKIIRKGIPLGLKCSMWQIMSGSCAHMAVQSKNYYTGLVKIQEENFNSPNVKKSVMKILLQIEKDLHRSLPDFDYYKQGGAGIVSLRRVLQAYAAHDPHIGYCQSMNIVTATLLLFTNEEEAFYLLCSIIQKVPEYYVNDMLGSIVDIRIFTDLLLEHDPILANHFQKIDVDLSLIGLPWFLCLFIGYIPWEASLRVIDCFFAEGTNVLLQVGLALLMIHRESLLKIKDIISINDYLKNAKLDTKKFCELAFDKISVDHSLVKDLRNFHKFQAIQEMHKRNEKTIFNNLRRKTKFTADEIEMFYAEFKSFLDVSAVDHQVDLPMFKIVFSKHISWWPTNLEIVFKYLDKRSTNKISFSDYCTLLDIVFNGKLLQVQKLAFDIFETKGNLNSDSFMNAMAVIYAIYSHRRKKREAEKQKEIEDNNTVEKIEDNFEEIVVENLNNDFSPKNPPLSESQQVWKAMVEKEKSIDNLSKIDFTSFQSLSGALLSHNYGQTS